MNRMQRTRVSNIHILTFHAKQWIACLTIFLLFSFNSENNFPSTQPKQRWKMKENINNVAIYWPIRMHSITTSAVSSANRFWSNSTFPFAYTEQTHTRTRKPNSLPSKIKGASSMMLRIFLLVCIHSRVQPLFLISHLVFIKLIVFSFVGGERFYGLPHTHQWRCESMISTMHGTIIIQLSHARNV